MKYYYSQFKAMYKQWRKKMRLAKGFQYVLECQGADDYKNITRGQVNLRHNFVDN